MKNGIYTIKYIYVRKRLENMNFEMFLSDCYSHLLTSSSFYPHLSVYYTLLY